MGTRSKENGGQTGFLSRLGLKRAPSPAASPQAAKPAMSPGNLSRLPTAPQSARAPRPGTAAAAAGQPPASRGQLLRPPRSSGADSPTPRNFAKPPQSARGPAPLPSARGPAPMPRAATPPQRPADGSLTARRVPEISPSAGASTPGSSTYRDALCTSRNSRLPAPPPSARPDTQQQQQQQQLFLVQQQARASHELEHTQQQISRLEGGMAAKQAELQEALASLEALNKRREALAEHVARLGQLSTQAKAAEEGRRVELQELELSLKSLQAGLEGHKLQEVAAADKAAAARAALLHMMQTAAHTLKLPASVQLDIAGPGGRASTPLPLPAAAAAAPQLQQQQACPMSPSDAGSQGFITPAASIAGGEVSSSDDDDAYDDGSSSSGAGSPRAAGEVTARHDLLPSVPLAGAAQPQPDGVQQRRGPLLPRLRLSGLGAEGTAAAEPGSARAPPSSRIPGVSLVSPPPAAAGKASKAGAAEAGAGVAGVLSPAVLLRLQSISSKLEAALADQAMELDVGAA